MDAPRYSPITPIRHGWQLRTDRSDRTFPIRPSRAVQYHSLCCIKLCTMAGCFLPIQAVGAPLVHLVS